MVGGLWRSEKVCFVALFGMLNEYLSRLIVAIFNLSCGYLSEWALGF